MRSIQLTLALSIVLASTAHAQTPSGGTPNGTAPAASSSPPAGGESSVSPAVAEGARAHFRLGVDFYRERNFRAALIEFQRAYADAPHYKLLYNLGQASLELQEYAGAIDFLTDYLTQGGAEIAAERRQEVEATIRSLESRVAQVVISSNREGAEIFVDDTSVGRIPLDGPVRVGAGRHKLTAVAEGLQPMERVIDVAAQEHRDVRIDFEDKPEVTPVGYTPVDTTIREERTNVPLTVAIITTAALGVGALTMTLVSGLAQKKYDEEIDSVTTKSRLDDLSSDAETKALITDIAWGATLVSAVVTTVLVFTSGDNEHSEHAALPLNLSVTPDAVSVGGRF